MKISSKVQCVEQLKKFGKELNEVVAKKKITQKIEQFLDENNEFFKEDAEIATQLNAVGVRVKAQFPDSPLCNKIRGCVQEILPGDADHRIQSLNLLRRGKAGAESISDWIDLLDIPVDELGLTFDEIKKLFLFKFHTQEIPIQKDSNFLQKVKESTEHEKKIIIVLAKSLARLDSLKVAKFIQNFGIKDQAALVEIAKLCAKSNVSSTAQYIKNFGIKNQAALIEIAKLCAKEKAYATAKLIKNFGIKNQAALIKIAKLCAKEDAYATAKLIKNFSIKNQAELIEIAKLCAKENAYATAQFIQNFGIDNPAALIEIAKLCAQQDDYGTAEFIQNFGIDNPDALIEIAKLYAQQSGETAQFIQNFGIDNPDVLIEIAKVCAKENAYLTAGYIKNFGIKDQATLIEMAKLCAQQDGRGTAEYITRFGIKDQNAMIEIAKLCAQQGGWQIAKLIQKFGIKDPQVHFDLFLECLKQDDAALSVVSNFTSIPEPIHNLSRRIDKLKSDELEPEKREEFFIDLKEFIEGLPISDENKAQVHTIAHDILELVPYQQSPQARWLLRSLILISQMDREAADWIVERGVLRGLRELRDLSLKNQLSSELLELAQSSEGREDWETRLEPFSLKKGMQLIVLPLQSLINQGVDSKLIDQVVQSLSTMKVADDAMKIQRLLQVLQLISSSRLMTAAMKSSALVRIFSVNSQLKELEDQKKKANPREGKLIKELTQKIGRAKADDERRILKNLAAVKGLMQLREIDWIDSPENLDQLFVDCFTKLVPLEEFKGDAADLYEKNFGSSRNPTGLITYAAGLKTLNDPEVLPCLGRFVVSVFNKTFRDMRYETTNNPHLTQIYETRPDLMDKWHKCPQVKPQLVTKGVQQFNPTDWLRTKLVHDQHMGSADVSFVTRYMGANDADAREKVQHEIVKALHNADRKTEPNLKLQLACIQLASVGNERPLSDLESPFRDIEESLKGIKAESEFAHDVDGILKAIKQAQTKASAQEEFFAMITDDPIDLMLAGTDVSGSCQRLDGDPNLNKGLLGYLMDGKNQMIAIKDKSGKIVARAMLRLLWDGEKPVLFREHFYPDAISENEMDAMNKMALELGKDLDLCVTTKDKAGSAYEMPLQALGGPAPWEYSDAAGGVEEKGSYTVFPVYLLE